MANFSLISFKESNELLFVTYPFNRGLFSILLHFTHTLIHLVGVAK